jgi:hypothetical protein
MTNFVFRFFFSFCSFFSVADLYLIYCGGSLRRFEPSRGLVEPVRTK